jgi:hypothetical protein
MSITQTEPPQMIAFPELLVAPAKTAGIKVPEDVDNYNKENFPHFYIFCTLQLGARMPTPNSHWLNAKIIAEIPEAKIKFVTLENLMEMGWHNYE